MKLSTDAPEQHLAILCVAGFCVFVSVISAFTSGDEADQDVANQQASYLESGITKYDNPQLTWWEKLFCRGYQRSQGCGYRFMHPLKQKFEDLGIEVQEAPANKVNAVDYNGSLPTNRAFSGRIKVEHRHWEQPAWVKRNSTAQER